MRTVRTTLGDNLWRGCKFVFGEGKFQRFPDMTRPDAAFSDLRTLDIVEIEPNRLWIATDGGGITVLDAITGRTDALRHDPLEPNSLSSDNIVTLLRDDQGFGLEREIGVLIITTSPVASLEFLEVKRASQ